MKLICYREGRAGVHIGDVFEINDDADAFDGIHLKVLEEPVAVPKPAKPLAEAEAKTDQE